MVGTRRQHAAAHAPASTIAEMQYGGSEGLQQAHWKLRHARVTLWPNKLCRHVNLAYKLDINEFRGRTSLQLMVEGVSALLPD